MDRWTGSDQDIQFTFFVPGEQNKKLMSMQNFESEVSQNSHFTVSNQLDSELMVQVLFLYFSQKL